MCISFLFIYPYMYVQTYDVHTHENLTAYSKHKQETQHEKHAHTTADVIEYELLPRTALVRKKLDALEDAKCGCICHGEPSCGRSGAVNRWGWEKVWAIGTLLGMSSF